MTSQCFVDYVIDKKPEKVIVHLDLALVI